MSSRPPEFIALERKPWVRDYRKFPNPPLHFYGFEVPEWVPEDEPPAKKTPGQLFRFREILKRDAWVNKNPTRRMAVGSQNLPKGWLKRNAVDAMDQD